MITKFTYEDRRVTDARLLSLALFELRHCPLHQLSQPPATLFDGLAHFLRFLRGLLFSLLAQRSCWGFNLHVVSLAAFQTAHLLRPRKLPHRFCLAGLQVDGKLPLLLLWKFAHLLLGVYPQAFLQLLAVILGVKAAQDVHDRLVRIHEDPVELRVVVKTDRVHRPLGPGGEERHLHGQRVRHHREALSEGLVLLLISKVVPAALRSVEAQIVGKVLLEVGRRPLYGSAPLPRALDRGRLRQQYLQGHGKILVKGGLGDTRSVLGPLEEPLYPGHALLLQSDFLDEERLELLVLVQFQLLLLLLRAQLPERLDKSVPLLLLLHQLGLVLLAPLVQLRHLTQVVLLHVQVSARVLALVRQRTLHPRRVMVQDVLAAPESLGLRVELRASQRARTRRARYLSDGSLELHPEAHQLDLRSPGENSKPFLVFSSR
mmetsp:Transcript_548/g.1565  ORF Transcript_548/g.1565 Transcript_548/m.1565 type:complete len:431 (+) Transcript_548:3409-4701(+)